jgi:DNA-binding CsgD family transcriptional regulator
MRWLDDLQRVCTSAQTAYASRRERNTVDVTDLLAQIRVPTLILHSRGDRMNSFDEARLMAATIPGARLVPLESDNHILLEGEPAWAVFRHEVATFLEPDRPLPVAAPQVDRVAALSERELEVLRLAAEGNDNDTIAAALVLSVRTVERHLQNIYAKLEVSGRSARAAAVARLLTSD